jgi:N-acetylglucosaminyl-diphospho-decaprenol L-rhamnosyltransferase
MNLGIVIVNYRTGDLAIDCLRSLASVLSEAPDARVIVVDNASGDGSAGQIGQMIAQRQWGQWASLMELPANTGYAAGNNAAIRGMLGQPQPPRYVLLLNPDTVVRPGALAELLKFMDAHSDAGIAGSRLEDPDGTPQRSAFRFPTIRSEFDAGLRLGIVSRLLRNWLAAPPVRDDAHATDWVAGASMIVRSELFSKIGLLDEAYFMYFEEVDFCFAAKKAGWPCWYVPSSRVVHLVGQSSGVTDTRRAPSRRPTYWFESRRRFFVKNRGKLSAVMADLAFAVGFVLWRLRRPLQGKPDLDPPCLLWDTVRHSALIRGIR